MRDLRDVLLVDGYNMIGGWPELAELSKRDLQEARDRLLERLADYQAFSGRSDRRIRCLPCAGTRQNLRPK
ncbi:hypothetical protein HMSSN036_37520 [Paenibacillus macerans]|nr:hypothetical protein HMSSN036_37520 [Paenibacillus macerans]